MICLCLQISIRLFVSGLRTDLPTLKRLVTSFNCTTGTGIRFDEKVYGKIQKLAMILCKKGRAPQWVHGGKIHSKGSDDRILRPVGFDSWHDKKDINRLSMYVAQVVDQKDVELVCMEGSSCNKGTGSVMNSGVVQRKNVNTGLWETVNTETGDVLDEGALLPRDGSGKKRRVNSMGLDRAFDVMIPVLHKNGFLNPRIVPGSEDFNGERMYCSFNCDNHMNCRICGHDHERNNYYFNASNGGINVGNFSQRCHPVSLFDPVFLHKKAEVIKDHSKFSHFVYAKLYKDYKGDVMVYEHKSKKFMSFDGSKWVEMPMSSVKTDVANYFSTQLCEAMLEKIETWLGRVELLNMTVLLDHLVKLKKDLTDRSKGVGSKDFINGVVSMLEGLIIVEPEAFDRNDDFLHFDDGVLDLKTMLFRETWSIDMNTMTTGFNFYNEDFDIEGAKLHDRVVQTIFTDERVRNVARMVFGTSLTARPVKMFFVHTDGGGEKAGNNGKTLLMDIHHATMGSYACKPRREMFVKDLNATANSATTALNALTGKRVGTAEELEANKQLNESEIKNWTNGTNAQIASRGLYQSQQNMRLTCKFHVGANNNKFPKCDAVGDQALKDRLFIIPYMSKFVNVPHDRPFERVFVRDNSLSNKIDSFRWHHMQWCLEGYKEWSRDMGLLDYERLPHFMQQFKDGVLVQQSPVYGILLDLIMKADVLDIQTNIRKNRGLEVGAVWVAVKQDKRFRGYMDKGMVQQAFISVCKGEDGCEGCIKHDRDRGCYSTHHKLRNGFDNPDLAAASDQTFM